MTTTEVTPGTWLPEDRVARGAAWYDTVYPAWYQRIDLDSLNMENACDCAAGQVLDPEDRTLYRTLDVSYYAFGFEVLEWLAQEAFGVARGAAWVIDHGFMLGGDDDSWWPLHDAWRAEVLRRREVRS